MTYSASLLPPSGGTALFAWGSGTTGGGSSFWAEVHGQVTRTLTDIGLDTSKLTIDLNLHHVDNEIDWRGELTLPAGATIDPAAEAVSVALRSGGASVFEMTIPPGSFVAHPNGSYRYKFSSDSPAIEMRLTPRGGSLWEFRLSVEGIPLTIANRTQITGRLTIGDKVGTQVMPMTDKGKRLEFKKP